MHLIFDISKTGKVRTVHSVVLDGALAFVDELETKLLVRALLALDVQHTFTSPRGHTVSVSGAQLVKMLLAQAATDSALLLPMAQAILCTVRGGEGNFQFLNLPPQADMAYRAMSDWVSRVVDAWYTGVEEYTGAFPKPFKTQAFKQSLARLVLDYLPEIFHK